MEVGDESSLVKSCKILDLATNFGTSKVSLVIVY